ncbi:hypothetical protein H310_13511 [Aphanomyces invadans]|uniref:Uncharacterized protein n=1 Tax=Aphanomyces invadans TaxID=157072 RepID=A0A024TD56_9STRA|nr:hypothetical protein H310_13511 [Aphanomyces invadans]ETV92100.1 hypothetical protein H310_13511 [Aphanomyces invadans]|eukprot:XP_008879262.1 hypothetical protein H310_13511 [Aphanomyces invadans]
MPARTTLLPTARGGWHAPPLRPRKSLLCTASKRSYVVAPCLDFNCDPNDEFKHDDGELIYNGQDLPSTVRSNVDVYNTSDDNGLDRDGSVEHAGTSHLKNKSHQSTHSLDGIQRATSSLRSHPRRTTPSDSSVEAITRTPLGASLAMSYNSS